MTAAPTGPAAGAPARRRPRQWLALLAVALVIAVVCLMLGRWQWNRHIDRSARIATVQENFNASPLPLASLLAFDASDGDIVSASIPDDNQWHPAQLTGTYLDDYATLLRNRPADSVIGFHALVPFATDVDGESVVILVDRGFLPGTQAPSTTPAPPDGLTTIVVRLRAAEAADSREPSERQVYSINPVQAAAAGGLPDADAVVLHGVYGALVSEDPAGEAGLQALPEPSIDPGSHLSYAFQWWFFSAGSLAAVAVLYRRETSVGRPSLDDVIAAGSGAAPAERPSAAALVAAGWAKAGRGDQEFEDAQIAAQLRDDTTAGGSPAT